MKYHQQVSVDLVNMVYTAIAYLALAGAAWLFLRLLQACFWLPSKLKRQNDVQFMLQEKVDSYERYIEECEAKEDAGEAPKDDGDERSLEEKRKERRECLDLLKRELQRIKDGGDPDNFDYLLNEEEKRLLDDCDKIDEEEEEEEGEKAEEGAETEEKEKDTESEKLLKCKQDLEAKVEPKKDK